MPSQQPAIDRSTCPGDLHDGTPNAYSNHGCRCPHTKAAQSRYRKQRRAGIRPDVMVDSTGTVRRLRALAVIGYTWATVGDVVGMDPAYVSRLARALFPTVTRATAAKVTVAYTHLCTTRGGSVRSSRRALVKGWHSPLAWSNIDDPAEQPDSGEVDDATAVDEPDLVVVERLVAGHDIPAARSERNEAIRRLIAAGTSKQAVLDRFRVGPNTVKKILEAA